MRYTTFAAAAVAAAVTTAPLIAQAEVIDSYTTADNTKGRVYHIHPTDQARTTGSSALTANPGPELESKGIQPTASLVQQLNCHMAFAGNKPVWNIESWRPEVSVFSLILHGCNP
ncbi:DUF2599 domain-containing protein [Corynebacterium halotolerans]|uniref:DUF2599 domain-containing protein n=1 Tax=Corynebacterium halotolerans YIM 70093 = DSM 44683 TaxID=1121362 RepID=M1NR56_9CORY|nr:DUF2599 domain-containing protein [Corynebacterium halotolerans]AGF71982.1 hypothetical protein A605_04870 [Corynebacterium halotolerans YIM 70093 = DSM 44683]